MAAHGKRPAAQTALLIVAPLLVLLYAGVLGWLWWAGPPDGAADAGAEPHAAAGENPGSADADGHSEPAGGHGSGEETAHGSDAGADHGKDEGHGPSETAGHDAPAESAAEGGHGDGHGDGQGGGQAEAGHDSAPSHAAETPDHGAESDTHAKPDAHDFAAGSHGAETADGGDHAPAPPHGADEPERRAPPQQAEPEPQPEGVESFERTPLPPAPDPELTDKGRYGPLPIRSPDGRVAWQAYGRPFEVERGQPVIAVVISELGLAEPATLSAIQDLPGEITLAFSPYSTRLKEWVPAARAAGHEVLIQVPMEPRNTAYDDPGDKALLSSNQPEVNIDRLHWVLSRAVGYVGVTNFMGSRLTVSPKDMQPILEAIGARGLLYVDARVTPASIAATLSAELGVPSVANDRFIDDEAARGPIDRRLAQLEELALARGVAVGFAQPYPVTVERLRKWIPQMRQRGFRLAPVSAVVRVGGGGDDDG